MKTKLILCLAALCFTGAAYAHNDKDDKDDHHKDKPPAATPPSHSKSDSNSNSKSDSHSKSNSKSDSHSKSDSNSKSDSHSKSNSNSSSVSKGGSAKSTSNSKGGSANAVGNQSQSQTMNNNPVYQSGERAAAASANAAPLVSSNDTCMGSTSVAGSAVSFGFSAGTTWTDENCVLLKNAREMWNMGFKGAALARMCMDDKNRDALESAGIVCPARRSSKEARANDRPAVAQANSVFDSRN